MEKILGPLVIPILECGRVSLRILLFSGQPSRCFDALAGHNGWQAWLGLLALAFVPWMVIFKSVHINWFDMSFLCSFALINVMYLAVWLLTFNLFLRHSSIDLDELLLMTSVYYGSLFFWTSVLGLLLGIDYFGESIRLAGLFKAGQISVWDVPKLSWNAPNIVTVSGLLKAILAAIVWPLTYSMCSAGLCLKITSKHQVCNERIHYALVMTSVIWITTVVAASTYITVPFFSVFVE